MDDTQELYHLKEDTTHVVIVFVEENKKKKNVELVPRSWLVLNKKKLLCYYPNQLHYGYIKKWVEKNKEPDRKNWKQFEVRIVKEANSYAQGLRRLTKSYVVEDVESSSQIESLDDKNGKKKNNADQSEIPVTLRENETREVLQAIPVFQPNLREVQTAKRLNSKSESEYSENSAIEDLTQNLREGSKSENECHDTSCSDDTFIDSVISSVSKRNNSTGHTLDRKNITKDTRKIQDNQQISTGLQRRCSSCLELQVEFEKINKNFEAKLESVKRSILYDLNKKINELKTMMKAANKPEIDEILQQREILPPLPMTTLEDFQQFEEQLNESQDISAALKSFMLLNSNLLPDFKTVINAILPMIITKNVQIQFSGFGRITKGQRKENFSKTKTYYILKEITLQKCNDISIKDFNSYITRWLSNAGDRDGGKQQRNQKK